MSKHRQLKRGVTEETILNQKVAVLLKRPLKSLEAELERRKGRIKLMRAKFHEFNGWVKAYAPKKGKGNPNPSVSKQFAMFRKGAQNSINVNYEKIQVLEEVVKELRKSA